MFVITIGRNINNIPMGPKRWANFKEDVQYELNYHGFEDKVILRPMMGVGASDCVGVWEGNQEQAACWVVDDEPSEQLRLWLAEVAYTYEQDAIGLIVGKSQLITALRD